MGKLGIVAVFAFMMIINALSLCLDYEDEKARKANKIYIICWGTILFIILLLMINLA